MPNVRVMLRTTVTGAYDGGTFGALERVAEHVGERPEGAPLQCFWRIAARRAVLCAGALERPVAFAEQRPAGGDAGGRGPGLPQPLGGGAAAGGGLHRQATTAGGRRRTWRRRGSR